MQQEHGSIPAWILRRGDFYYGWIIVAVALVSMAFWLGTRSSFSVFYVALLEEFPWKRAELAGAQSAALLVYTLLAPLVGGLIDRYGPRRIIVPGVLTFALGLTLCASVETLSRFYLYYGLVMGSGITCIGIVSYSAVLAHWFERKRGLASGIAVSGMGLGTFLLVPFSQQLIAWWGWRVTFAASGALALLLLLPLNGLLLRHKPAEVGQPLDGTACPDSPQARGRGSGCRPSSAPDLTFREALRTRAFWGLVGFTALSIVGVYILLVHNVRFLVDQGLPRMTAALIFALVGVVSSLFRIFWGWLSDRIGRQITFSLGALCGCLGAASLLFFERTGSRHFVYFFLVLFGMGWGVTAPMFMAVAADLFSGRTFGLIYGAVEAGIGAAGALGAWSGGYIFDRTGSYAGAFILAMILIAVSGGFVWLAAPPRPAGAT